MVIKPPLVSSQFGNKYEKKFYKIIAKTFLNRLGRNQIPLGGEDALKNDDLFVNVYGLTENKEDYGTLMSINNCELTLRFWDGEKNYEKKEDISILWKNKCSVRWYFKGWQINYDNLLEPFFHILIRYNYIRKRLQKGYDQSLSLYRDRIGFLKIMIDLRKPGYGKTYDVEELLSKIYGTKINLSEDKYLYYEFAVFMIRSLKESGDVECNIDGIIPTKICLSPKALQTLHEFESNEQRHRDSLNIVRWQFGVAVAMFLVAVTHLIIIVKK